MNYDNLTDQQVRDIINEAAKDNPSMLTSALRAAGNFCYLVAPEDIEEYIKSDPEEYKDLNDLGYDEAGEVMSDYRNSLIDCVDYNGICSAVVDAIRSERNRNKS